MQSKSNVVRRKRLISKEMETHEPKAIIFLAASQLTSVFPKTFNVPFKSIWCMGVSEIVDGTPFESSIPTTKSMTLPMTGAVECTGFTVDFTSEIDANRFRKAISKDPAFYDNGTFNDVLGDIDKQEGASATINLGVIGFLKQFKYPLVIGIERFGKTVTGGGTGFAFTIYFNSRSGPSDSEAKINSPFIGYATCATCRGRAVHQCSRCKGAHYCSKGCQETHWRSGHKRHCRK